MDVGEDSRVAEALEEGVHKMMDRGRGVEHAEISIVHPMLRSLPPLTQKDWRLLDWDRGSEAHG